MVTNVTPQWVTHMACPHDSWRFRKKISANISHILILFSSSMTAIWFPTMDITLSALDSHAIFDIRIKKWPLLERPRLAHTLKIMQVFNICSDTTCEGLLRDTYDLSLSFGMPIYASPEPSPERRVLGMNEKSTPSVIEDLLLSCWLYLRIWARNGKLLN